MPFPRDRVTASILLVEDDRPIAENVILALARENLDCRHVTLAAEGLALLRGGGFDLAILDVGLPDGNGFDLCRALRSFSDLPVIFLTGLAFAALGLIVTALAPSYDFFMYYFTLFITPMVLLCGVFFPVVQLPDWLQAVSAALPLTHAVAIARPLLVGEVPGQVLLHVMVLAGYGLVAFHIALVLARRRLLR